MKLTSKCKPKGNKRQLTRIGYQANEIDATNITNQMHRELSVFVSTFIMIK